MLRPPPSSTLFPYTTLFRSALEKRIELAGDRHDLQRERVLAFHDAFDELTAGAKLRGTKPERDGGARLTQRDGERLARARRADGREIGSERAALPAHLMATGACLAEQRTAAARVTRSLERGHHADAAQMRDDRP